VIAFRPLAPLAVVCALSAAAAPAVAAPVQVALGDTLQVQFLNVNPGSGSAGMYNWTTGGTTYDGLVYSNPSANKFVTFCVEQSQNTSGSMSPYTLLALEQGPNPGTHMTPATANALRAMWAQYFHTLDTNAEAAAFQEAVWHLIANGPGPTPSTSGLKSTYLTQSSWQSGYANLAVLSNGSLQDQLVQVNGSVLGTPTPEPGMLALGLLVLPAVYLRRKLAKKA
jgi:hypothetical protein